MRSKGPVPSWQSWCRLRRHYHQQHHLSVVLPNIATTRSLFLVQAALRQLTANSCHGLSSVTIQLPSTSPLETLSMAGCRKLKSIYVSAPQLQELSVDSNPQLNSLELQCPGLTSLSASKCASLTGLAALECPALQHLNLFGCRQLQTEGGLAILPQPYLHKRDQWYQSSFFPSFG